MDAAWTRAPGSARAHDARGRFGPNANVMAMGHRGIKNRKSEHGKREREGEWWEGISGESGGGSADVKT